MVWRLVKDGKAYDRVIETVLQNEKGKSVQFTHELCTGCNICVNVCRVDVLIPNQAKGFNEVQISLTTQQN